MKDVLQNEVDEIGAIALSHSVILAALFSVVEAKGLLNKAEINEVFDIAQTALDKAEADSPRVIRNARRMLDETARSLAARS